MAFYILQTSTPSSVLASAIMARGTRTKAAFSPGRLNNVSDRKWKVAWLENMEITNRNDGITIEPCIINKQSFGVASGQTGGLQSEDLPTVHIQIVLITPWQDPLTHGNGSRWVSKLLLHLTFEGNICKNHLEIEKPTVF